MSNRRNKDALFEAFAGVAKALASGRRAELVDVLAQGERPVDDLAVEIGQSVANTSHHLRTLAQAGLVQTRRDGTRIFYSLASELVAELWAALRDVAADHVAGIDRFADAYLGPTEDIETMTREELVRRLEQRDIIVLDVRPASEYAAGHVSGARSVPPDELVARLQTLPEDVDIVAYCRGPFCVYANDAVRELQRRGARARRLEGGFPEWRRHGLPVSSGRGAGR
ncbi:MAG: metalloregulator ArsR/SmtB family transcription factor [Acidimicrobiia bacterium]